MKLFVTICAVLAIVAVNLGCGPNVREEVEEFWPNGNPKKVIVYTCGKKHCKLLRTTYYFEDGQIQSDILYTDGVLDGVTTIYNPDGSIYKQTTFDKGQKVAEVMHER